MRISESHIVKLQENEIFVFGSNLSGRHGKGAAKTARTWGAIYGQAEGKQGQTYGIPTVDHAIKNPLSIDEIQKRVQTFENYARQHPELKFLVTEIGCGLAGHTVREIGPLFQNCSKLHNVYLPESFWKTFSKTQKTQRKL